MTTTLKVGKSLFNDIYWPYRLTDDRIQIFFGGSSSGKSVFLSDRCIEDILNGGRNYLIVRNTANTIRSSVFNEVKKSIQKHSAQELFDINKSEMVITCKNGYQILFKGLDDVEKIKSITPAKGIITDIWVEEATETTETDIIGLQKRLRGKTSLKKRVMFSFNPILQTHWIYKKFFAGYDEKKGYYHDNDLLILHTTYKDNRFLAPDDITALESETNQYFYDVYTLGKWGVLGDLVYNNWHVQDFSDIKHTFDIFYNGLDFGFSVDPTAFLRAYIKHDTKEIYILNCWKERGLTNDKIADRLNISIGTDDITCDSSEPKSIQELVNFGVNAFPAIKGKDSVWHGIQWLQQYTILIDPQCQEFLNEIRAYQWQKDKYGESINKPVDRNNHLMDALRYAFENEMLIPEWDDSDEVGVGQSVSAFSNW